jgi:hypothetical protein
MRSQRDAAEMLAAMRTPLPCELSESDVTEIIRIAETTSTESVAIARELMHWEKFQGLDVEVCLAIRTLADRCKGLANSIDEIRQRLGVIPCEGER